MCLTNFISTGYVIEITSLPQISNRLLCSRNHTIERDNCEIIYSTVIQMGDLYLQSHLPICLISIRFPIKETMLNAPPSIFICINARIRIQNMIKNKI